ncbi:MAG: acetylornithine deacetylase [Candidatus Binatus sp.]|uniref:acetylornithine deacetylase n=1 Tax=Candidatus Binatus sp. TaxID=2811406 RepID=UPI0027234FE0|nr:acetylornithine deacetylase [Candidatus Binatus sp.]MDO8434595.1 acetylornithine deacetylase [Candidatus Binatus sp.]
MYDYLYEAAKRLIGFDTVSSNSAVPAMEYLAKELASRGFKTALQPVELLGVSQANLVAWAGPPRSDGLIVSAHVDTVPYAGQPGWEREPLKFEAAGDRIYGRGASDMKGFIANCLDAVRTLDTSKLKRPLVFVFTASEEVGCLGAHEVAPALRQILGECPVPKLAWIGEPSSYEVYRAHKSIVSFGVTVRGIGGHSGAPARGVNAIAVMGRVIEAIGRLQEARRISPDPEFQSIFPDAPTDVVNFGTVKGGLALNMIAEECALRVSYRTLPNADPLQLYREVEQRIAELDTTDYASHEHRATVELGRTMVVPPLNSPPGTPLERVLFDLTGAKTSGGALYGTDGGWFTSSGIVSLICGPGDLDQAHQPNEYIRREPFERGTAMVHKVIERMCNSE